MSQTDTRERDTARARPRIYVASLPDYNAGRPHGRWIDAAQDAASAENNRTNSVLEFAFEGLDAASGAKAADTLRAVVLHVDHVRLLSVMTGKQCVRWLAPNSAHMRRSCRMC